MNLVAAPRHLDRFGALDSFGKRHAGAGREAEAQDRCFCLHPRRLGQHHPLSLKTEGRAPLGYVQVLAAAGDREIGAAKAVGIGLRKPGPRLSAHQRARRLQNLALFAGNDVHAA